MKNPEVRAKDLLLAMLDFGQKRKECGLSWSDSKNISLLIVNEFIDFSSHCNPYVHEYWLEVKSELEKL